MFLFWFELGVFKFVVLYCCFVIAGVWCCWLDSV